MVFNSTLEIISLVSNCYFADISFDTIFRRSLLKLEYALVQVPPSPQLLVTNIFAILKVNITVDISLNQKKSLHLEGCCFYRLF